VYVNRFLEYCRRYLLICITLCYSAGVWISSELRFPPEFFLYAALFLFLLTLLTWFARCNNIALIFLCLAMVCTGGLNAQERRSLLAEGDEISRLLQHGEEAVIVGVVRELQLGSGDFSKAILTTHSFRTERSAHFVRAGGRVLIHLYGTWPQEILPGDTVGIRSRVKTPAVLHTPGTFNYRRFLARNDIHLIARVQSPLLIQTVTMEGTTTAASLGSSIERYRALVGLRLNRMLTQDSAGLYRALLIGDRSGISPAILELFKGSGVMHILAISGLHLALLGVIIFSVMTWMFRRSERLMLATDIRKLALLLCLIPLLGYTLLAGAGPPVVRSFVMSACVVIALMVNRRKSPLTLLAAAAMFLLILDPLSLEDVSFQLSFAAVFSLITLAPRMFNWLYPDGLFAEKDGLPGKLMKWLWGAVTVSGAATIGTLPLLLYHFNRISLVTIPANLVIEPLICLWSLPCGLLGLIFLPFSQELAALFLKAGTAGLTLSVKSSEFLSSLPLSTVWLPDPHIWVIGLYFIGLAMLSLPRSRQYLIKTAVALLLICMGLMVLPVTGLPGLLRDRDQVTFLAIGHGSCNVIELSNGQNILIDGGGKSAPGFDPGARILAPFLWEQGIARLDDIIITHPDADHYNGIPALLERFRPRRIWLSDHEKSKEGFIDLLQLAEKYGIEVRPGVGDILPGQSDTLLTVLEAAAGAGASEDDRGLVLKLETPSFSVLFPGDISRNREQELISSRVPLKADILLSAHHGSSTSNSEQFLAEVSPAYMVVSSGEVSGSRFPSEETKQTARKLNIGVLITAAHGTVVLTSRDSGYSLTTYRTP
jgi:competence protein ComEC